MGDNQPAQEVIDGKDKEEIGNVALGTVIKIEESTTRSSLSTKHECRTTLNKASPKP